MRGAFYFLSLSYLPICKTVCQKLICLFASCIDSVPNSHRRPNCPRQGSRGVMIIVSQPLPSEVNQTVQQLAVQALHAGFTPLQGDVQGAGEAATGGGGPANPGFHGGAEPPPGGPEREGVRSFLDPSMGRMGIGWRNRMGRGLSSPPPAPASVLTQPIHPSPDRSHVSCRMGTTLVAPLRGM